MRQLLNRTLTITLLLTAASSASGPGCARENGNGTGAPDGAVGAAGGDAAGGNTGGAASGAAGSDEAGGSDGSAASGAAGSDEAGGSDGSAASGEAGGGAGSDGSSGSAGNGSSGQGGSAASGESGQGGNVSGSGGSAGQGYAEGCPGVEPVNGTACNANGLSCTYGDALNPNCRDSFTCDNGLWSLSEPVIDCGPPSEINCPQSLPQSGSECGAAPAGTSCEYSDEVTVCVCIDMECPGPCIMIDPPQWRCHAPPATPGCPPTAPNQGTICEQSDLICNYLGGFCAGGIQAVCQQGVWIWADNVPCPICASPDTPVATPQGEMPMALLQKGDLVYSVQEGRIAPVPIIRTASTPIAHHRVMRVVLDNGSVLEISAGHPLADGRTFGDLRPGEMLDGTAVIGARMVPYRYSYTYDILPDSDSGTYFAGGVLIGSTLYR